MNQHKRKLIYFLPTKTFNLLISKWFNPLLINFLFILCSPSVFAQTKSPIQAIRNEFSNPSGIARTKLWWFHGETETTKEGITADLEAFKRAGVGGVVYYDQQHGKGENALLAFSKEWWTMFHFAAAEAKRLGLTFETHLSNGYVSGGPWITEDLSMQRIEATDTLVNGGQRFNAKLPAPARKSKSGKVNEIAVLAFPVPEGDWQTSLNRQPKVSSNIEQLNAKALFFPKDNKLINVPAPKQGESVYINLQFNDSFTARSITYSMRAKGKSTTGMMNMPGPPSDNFYGYGYVKQPDLGQLEVSEDGLNYTKVCDLKHMYESPSWNQRTISFAPVQGKHYRLNLHDWSGAKDGQDLPLRNIVISAQAKTDQWEDKAAFNSEFIEKDQTPDYAAKAVIDPKTIIDLTNKLTNGQLNWEVPKGKWVIMRFVRVSIGVNTKHGRPNLMGLESDKLSAEATKLQYNSYFKVMYDSLKKVGIPLTGLHMDSHEAGSQNWTIGFENKFKQLRGYNIQPYLPALLGYVVGSTEKTSGFLHDMRLTISDLVTSEYFNVLDSLCRKDGVMFTAQAVGNGITIAADNFKAKGKVQKPQGEFWAYQTHGSYDVKEASSAAHIYGKPIASAEAFTDLKFSQSLADAKNVADYAFAFGSQEFVVCASAYQPWLDKIPGSTGGGRQYVLNRNNTFWNYSRPFWDYQARCAALMRNGKSVADICIFLGENAPLKLLSNRLPEIPEGYDFDVTTEDGLLNRMSVKDGQIILPDGVKYQIFVLEAKADISLEALRQIAKMVNAGIAVYGAKPSGSKSLADAPSSKEYQTLVNQLWGPEQSGSKTVGKGKVYWGITLAAALTKHRINPDVAFKSGNIPTDKLYFAHRKLADQEIYFFNNHSKNVYNSNIRLCKAATQAEYWDPTTGKQYLLPIIESGKDGLLLNLVLQPNESGFIVTSTLPAPTLPTKLKGTDEKITTINGDWKVTFDPKWGGPGEVIFNKLTDWTQNEDKRIKFYSGTAVYRKTLQLDQTLPGEQILLRFAQLGSIARVLVNGKEVATVWCSPWEADLTQFVKKGHNTLEIFVVNALTNRMIGDSALPQSERFTYAYPEIASPKDRLVASGIIDKVFLVKRSK